MPTLSATGSARRASEMTGRHDGVSPDAPTRLRTLVAVALVLGAAAVVAGVLASRGGVDEPRAAPAPWTFAPPMSSRRSYVAAAQLGDAVYVAGGMVGEMGRPLATFQRLDGRRERWATLAP